MTQERKQYTVCVDFDGVLNSYKSGWTEPHDFPDPPVEGSLLWLRHLMETYTVTILTARLWDTGTDEPRYERSEPPDYVVRTELRNWLIRHGLPYDELKGLTLRGKPPAIMYIDDRAERFEGPGTFPPISFVGEFRPWWFDKGAP